MFAIGLLGASFLGLGVVPLSSAYTTCEAFGWETGVDWNWREAPAFYGLLAFFIGFAALFVMIPGLPLITVMFPAQVLNALLLPFILVFVMLLASDRELMGPLVSRAVPAGRSGWVAPRRCSCCCRWSCWLGARDLTCRPPRRAGRGPAAAGHAATWRSQTMPAQEAPE